MAAARVCALGMAILGGQAGCRAAGGPWWAEFALAAFVLLTLCLRIVFPQDSADKLAWWRDRGGTKGHGHRMRQHSQTRRHSQRRTMPRRQHEPVTAQASEHEQAPAGTAWRGPAS
jgi:hypothetical protein